MKKLRTLSHLQDFLDAEFSWRLKEIANLKVAVKKSEALSEKTIVRAAVPLLYAHWEGFIKNASTAYLNYVNNQGRPYRELQSCFVVFGVKKCLNELVKSRKSKVSVAAVDFLRAELEHRAQLKIDSAINTESNLSSSVFENIALSIGIDPSKYEARYHLIDESLLDRRNNIAHGEYLDLRPDEWRELADEVLLIIRQFKTDIENAATLALFVRTEKVKSTEFKEPSSKLLENTNTI